MDALVSMLILALAVVGGRYLYEGIQIVGNFVKTKLPVQAHAVALVVIQFGLLQFAQWIGIAMPEALDGFTPELTTAVVSAAAAMGWHAISGKKQGGGTS